MASRDIWRTGINVFTIHLIGEEIQVIFLYKVTNLVHFTTGIEITGRIVRITDQDGLGAFIDQLLELFHFRKGETFFDGSGNGTDYRTRRDGKGHIVGIGRFRHDDFIPRVQATQESEQHRFRTTGSDDDVVGIQIDVVFLVITHQLFTIALITL